MGRRNTTEGLLASGIVTTGRARALELQSYWAWEFCLFLRGDNENLRLGFCSSFIPSFWINFNIPVDIIFNHQTILFSQEIVYFGNVVWLLGRKCDEFEE